MTEKEDEEKSAESASAQAAREERLAAEDETRTLRMQNKFRQVADKYRQTRGWDITIEDVFNMWAELSHANDKDWR